MRLGRLPQRKGAVEKRLDSSRPHLLHPPLEILHITEHRATDLLLTEEEIPNIESDLCACHEAHGHDDAERFGGIDALGENGATEIVDYDVRATATGPFQDVLNEIVFCLC